MAIPKFVDQWSNRSFPSRLRFAVLTGNWKADLQTPQGKVQVSYAFTQDGEILSGTWQAAQSPTIQISDGKATGDEVSFAVRLNSR